jgi:CheY-like chemotaxis protein
LVTALELIDQVPARKALEARSAALEEALQRAIERDHRKTEFLATLAHELRNLLGPVVNSLQIMKRAHLSADLLERGRVLMERQVLQMKRLVDDLLDVNRIARNQLELKKTEVNLGLVLEQVLEASRPALETAGLTLTIFPPPQPVFLEADPVRLTQVFGNLLTNAGKYTDAGGRIDVAVEQQGSDVVVRVADNGVGIPADQLTTVFDRFVQIDGSVSRTQGGLGIGLALAKQLVELHGGAITAHSAGLGLGSEFVVRLPILTRHLMLPEPTPGLSQPVHPATLRILIVDDNRDAVESLAVLLALKGYETKLAHDGFEAIEQAGSYRPDVILLDIGLPRMSGYDVCRTIRAQPWGKAVVVIALTGWGQDDDLRRTADAGFTGHLVKPVNYEDLLKLLAQVGESACQFTLPITC